MTVKSCRLDAVAGSSDPRSFTPVSDQWIGPPSCASARRLVAAISGMASNAPLAANRERRLRFASVRRSIALPFVC